MNKVNDNDMDHWMLKASGEVLSRNTWKPLKFEGVDSKTEKKKRDFLMNLLRRDGGQKLIYRWRCYKC